MKTSILILIISLSPVATPNAQEQIFFLGQESGVGGRAMGMGGAFVGVSDDYSGLYWNPAGIGQIKKAEIGLGISYSILQNNTRFLGNETFSEGKKGRLNSVDLVVPIPTWRGSLVFGGGYHIVRDMDNTMELAALNEGFAAFPSQVVPTYGNGWKTDINGSLYQTEMLDESGRRAHYTAGVSAEAARNFFIGVSYNSIRGKSDYAFRFEESDPLDLYRYFNQGEKNMSDLDKWSLEQTINSTVRASNWKIGFLYRSDNHLRIGGTIATATNHVVKEEWREHQVEYYDFSDEAAILDNDGFFSYNYQEPEVYSLGASMDLGNLLISGAAEFQDWSQARYLSDPAVADQSREQVNNDLRKNLRGVTRLRVGAELALSRLNAKIRAGYYTDPSPYREKGPLPDRKYLTAGFNLQMGTGYQLDLAWIRAAWKQETSDDLTWYTANENKSWTKLIATLSIQL